MSSSTSTYDPEPSTAKHYRPRRIIFTAIFAALLVVVGVVTGVVVGRRNNDNDNDTTIASKQMEVDNILPFLQVSLNEETEEKVRGTMAVMEDRENFIFYSLRTDDNAILKFDCDKKLAAKSDEMDGWCGLEMTKVGNSSKVIVLSRYDGEPARVIDISKEDKELDKYEIVAMESFVGSKLAEYFVGLTFKLAAMGKTGATGLPYAQMHAEAQWIFSTATTKDSGINVKWDLGEVTHSSSSGRRLGLQETSIVEQINRHLLGDDAVDEIMTETAMIEDLSNDGLEWIDLDHGRNLGRCTLTNTCGNRCYGRCGPSCTCWSWVCGSCGCWDSCRHHDYYCSCRGWWHPFCLAAFWAIYC